MSDVSKTFAPDKGSLNRERPATKALKLSFCTRKSFMIWTVSVWVHLILSSNLFRKFWTLLQDLSCWHPVTTTQHLSWKTALASQRIKHKVACICFSAINGSGPAYLSELLHVYTPSPTLRSSSDTRMLEIQQYKRKTHGFRIFSCFGPHIWNSLPQDLRHCSTLSSFKAKLKTFLFSQYFHPN